MNRRERHVGGREDLGSVLDPTGIGSGEGDLGTQ
jgi:hypothetical protein